MTRFGRFTVIIIAALLVAVVAVWVLISRQPEPPVAGPKQEIPLATAREGFVEQTIALAGRVGPAAGTQAKLAFSVPGTVQSVDVRLGENVGAGAPLAQLDTTSLSLAAQQAGADAQAATAAAAAAAVDRTSVKLHVDRAELQRQRRLYEAGIVALRDVQAAQAMVAADAAESLGARHQRVAAQAQSRSASAHAASAGFDLSRTTLRAPAAGIVTGIFVQPGDTVDPTIPAIALTPALAHVATLDVPVGDVPRIAAGNVVRVQAGGRRFNARVAGIAPAVNPATGLAVIDIRGIPDDLPAGTPVDATVVVGQVRGLVVPRGAVVEDPQNGNTLIFVRTLKKDGSAHFESRVVTIDVENDTSVRVIAGLRAGERVAAQGAIDLLAPSSAGD